MVTTGRSGIPLGVERAHDGVVVDDVMVRDRVVGVDDVAELGHGHADPHALGVLERPLAWGPGRSSHRW